MEYIFNNKITSDLRPIIYGYLYCDIMVSRKKELAFKNCMVICDYCNLKIKILDTQDNYLCSYCCRIVCKKCINRKDFSEIKNHRRLCILCRNDYIQEDEIEQNNIKAQIAKLQKQLKNDDSDSDNNFSPFTPPISPIAHIVQSITPIQDVPVRRAPLRRTQLRRRRRIK